jgi:2-C-methyl-D-erythritol 2,4-cyclodiphosphate synthase
MFRVGFGTDIHRLVPGRPLIIGGVKIEHDVGADGHSDADVLFHAITDALLGALALGDIGSHFPDNDPRWKDQPSSTFLSHARRLVQERDFVVVNVDSVVDLERPRLRPHIDDMRRNVAEALMIDVDQVSIKAKTDEGVDAVGSGAAIRASCIVLIEAS